MVIKYLFQERKAQFAVEFIILLAVMFLIFLGVIAFVSQKALQVKEEERKEIAERISTLALHEIELAYNMQDGYQRSFKIPSRVAGNTYNISLIDNRELVVFYIDQEYVAFLKDNVIGNLSVGTNTISKSNGIIYING